MVGRREKKKEITTIFGKIEERTSNNILKRQESFNENWLLKQTLTERRVDNVTNEKTNCFRFKFQ